MNRRESRRILTLTASIIFVVVLFVDYCIEEIGGGDESDAAGLVESSSSAGGEAGADGTYGAEAGGFYGEADPRGDGDPVGDVAKRSYDGFRLMFYNVENLFDTYDDPHTNDNEFTPGGSKHWTKERYEDKLRRIAKVIASTSDEKMGGLPAFVGLAEVENYSVVFDLARKTELGKGKGNYAIVHQDSQDARGIDVALLYDRGRFELLTKTFYTPTKLKTRDILYVSGLLDGVDTLHIFVCHFPSMLGGEAKSNWKREHVADIVNERVDSILNINSYANIIICGDFNGDSGSAGLARLNVGDVHHRGDARLYDMAYGSKNFEKSYCYKGHWEMLDHIVLSTSLLDGDAGLKILGDKQVVKNDDFLLQENSKGYGWQPFPSYRGMYYVGGYSDHLPVYMDFVKVGKMP